MTTNPARALLAVAALLLLVLGLEWTLGGPEAPTIHGAPRPHHAAIAQDAPRETADWAATILARPLFSSSRRPAKITEAGRASASHMPRLAGIMITPQGRHAIFAGEGNGKPLVLGEGASVNDVRIRAIEPGQVILASGTVLKPAYDKLRIPAAIPPQPFVPGAPNFQGQNFQGQNFQGQNFQGQNFQPGAYPAPGLPGQFPAPGLPAGFVPNQVVQPATDAGDQDAAPPQPVSPQPPFPQPFRPNFPVNRRP